MEGFTSGCLAGCVQIVIFAYNPRKTAYFISEIDGLVYMQPLKMDVLHK